MLANYGYKDGSGDFFITIDTDKCTGCGDCIKVCPAKVLEMITDESDPFREIPVVAVTDEHRKKIKYSCSQCKPARPPRPEPTGSGNADPSERSGRAEGGQARPNDCPPDHACRAGRRPVGRAGSPGAPQCLPLRGAERDKGAQHKSASDLPCVKSCKPNAIAHSW